MDESSESSKTSPKPLAFTIDFSSTKNVDTQRQKALAEKLQKRHKRGQSLSKLENLSTAQQPNNPISGNAPRKSSFQSEGYYSSDEKQDKSKSFKETKKHSEMTLLLKHVSDNMTRSFPGENLPVITSPKDFEHKDISSSTIELDMIPFRTKQLAEHNYEHRLSQEYEKLDIGDNNEKEEFIEGTEFDFEKSDTASDTGTYTLDADNYSEDQKARMSIDREFNIEHVSVQKKTEEYIDSLSNTRYKQKTKSDTEKMNTPKYQDLLLDSPKSPTRWKVENPYSVSQKTKKAPSPLMSPTQNLSITQDIEKQQSGSDGEHNKTFTKILLPNPTTGHTKIDKYQDQGSIISVTSSGAFKAKCKKKQILNLTKSEVQVQAYIDDKAHNDNSDRTNKESVKATPKLTANIINVQSIEVKSTLDNDCLCANLVLGKLTNISPKCTSPVTTLPPMVGGKTSPTKIPSPIHTLSHPRSRNSISSLNVEHSDHNFDTDLILRPTQNYINSLQQRLLVDSDPDSDYDVKYGLQLNNTAHLLKQKTSHIRHNSLDDRTMNISNKLEHFQNKNFIGIDQTYTNLFNQYSQNKVIHKIQNSPNNSPIRRSSSFSTKNQFDSPKNTNVQKVSNMTYSPAIQRSASVQRSSSTACIKPNYRPTQASTISNHKKIDRNQFGDTESSSEEDFDKNIQKKKDLSNTSSTRSNRAFSLRRAHADNEHAQMNCPNTPKMKRKVFQPEIKQERAISVDRKPMKTNEVQSRYMLNISKRSTPPPVSKTEVKSSATKTPLPRPQSFTRTDVSRFSMRTNKPTTTSGSSTKTNKKDGKKSSSGGGGGPRSNSSLSSREVEFQNWKRRKSYDPMKAAAEGKRREAAARKTAQQDTLDGLPDRDSQSQESSPSHSGSVHRSQM
ncbi:unnamed protein product [Callosobruchus maculatus]|uniref:Uncharacterized protein n=1 Tax=Callosobruchus maculatus TaxID=64391 RepID=A0A653BQX5_CALMS|nr:unnamed protein product [Callosobruchus maculatus]